MKQRYFFPRKSPPVIWAGVICFLISQLYGLGCGSRVKKHEDPPGVHHLMGTGHNKVPIFETKEGLEECSSEVNATGAPGPICEQRIKVLVPVWTEVYLQEGGMFGPFKVMVLKGEYAGVKGWVFESTLH